MCIRDRSCREQCAEVVHGLSSPPWIPKSAGIGPTKWNNMKSGINRVETMNIAMISIECLDLHRLLTSDDRHDCSDHGDQNDPRIPNRCRAWTLRVFHGQESNCIFKRCISNGFPRLIGKIVIMETSTVWWMGNPAWFLLAWLVVAAASAWKFWRLTGAYRTKMRASHNSSSQFRLQLEKSWQRDGGSKNDLKMH